MKSPASLDASATAALAQAKDHALTVLRGLEQLQPGSKDLAQKHLPKIRANLSLLNKTVHEFSAYNNVLTTE